MHAWTLLCMLGLRSAPWEHLQCMMLYDESCFSAGALTLSNIR